MGGRVYSTLNNKVSINQITARRHACSSLNSHSSPLALLLSRPLAHLEVTADTKDCCGGRQVVGEREDLVDYGLVVPLHEEGRDGGSRE